MTDASAAAARALDEAVEHLYATFAHHPMPPDLSACDHCVDPADVERFRLTPLRELTPEQLGVYLLNPGTFGDETEFPHLLPRLLDLYAHGEMKDWSYPDALTRRIDNRWGDWSASERAAVVAVFRPWWRRLLHSYSDDRPFEAWHVLEAVTECGVDLGPFLADISDVPGEACARHLADVVYWWSSSGGSEDAAFKPFLIGDVPLAILDRAARTATDPGAVRDITGGQEHAALLRDWLRSEAASTS